MKISIKELKALIKEQFEEQMAATKKPRTLEQVLKILEQHDDKLVNYTIDVGDDGRGRFELYRGIPMNMFTKMTDLTQQDIEASPRLKSKFAINKNRISVYL